MEQKCDEGSKELQCIKTTLLASMQGYAPQVAVEFGRKVLYSTERPTFSELEGHVKGRKSSPPERPSVASPRRGAASGPAKPDPRRPLGLVATVSGVGSVADEEQGMAGDAKKLQPIIVKKVRKGGHGAHGGAWKIAYADFVTAMMAFFLLMWLLGSTTEGDKKGIAGYFQSPLKVSLFGGSGSGDSSHVLRGGGQDMTRQGGQVKRGEVEVENKHLNLLALKAEQRRAELARLQELRDRVEDVMASHPALAAMKSQIRLDMTRDGLRIQIVDEHNRPMFDSGSAVVKPAMREVLRTLATLFAEVPSRLTIEGHTDAQAFAAGARGYSNRELSSDRANASRRELVASGLPDDRVLRVQGLSSSQPIERDDPASPVNRRISIIVMNRDAEDRMFRTAPDIDTEPAAGSPPDRGPVDPMRAPITDRPVSALRAPP